MSIQHVADNVTRIDLMPCTARTSSTNGQAKDLRGLDGQALVFLASTPGVGTNPTLDVKLQESDDGASGWADVAGATFSQVGSGAAAEGIALRLSGRKRYLRAVATIGGTSPQFAFGVYLFAIQKQP